MNDNSGAFVTPVFYSDKKKTFESYFAAILTIPTNPPQYNPFLQKKLFSP
jgi:hypothetical protein